MATRRITAEPVKAAPVKPRPLRVICAIDSDYHVVANLEPSDGSIRLEFEDYAVHLNALKATRLGNWLLEAAKHATNSDASGVEVI